MTKIIWPTNLIEELGFRRTIIFFGSGISATAKNEKGERPATWKIFIEKSLSLMRNQHDEETKSHVDNLVSAGNYLDALHVIVKNCDQGEFSKLMREEYISNTYQASNIHQYIKDIDLKIVVTTNFDKIYESICSGGYYTTLSYKNFIEISNAIKTPMNVIIKAHGEFTSVKNIIFTAGQYFDAQANYPRFYELLKALFITHTVLFIGYSLNDPDINLVLQDVKNTSNDLSPNYIVLKEGTNRYELEKLKEYYNVSPLVYGPSYDDLEENILELRDLVLEFRDSR